MKINKLGVMGGLFDPIHNGHLSLGHEALKQLELDEIIYVPTYSPPHRGVDSPFKHRCRMVQLAIADIPQFTLSDLESRLPEPSYTVSTLQQLALERPLAKFYFIVGSDNLNKIEDWHEPEKIFGLAEVVMGNRPGADEASSGRFSGRILRIRIPPLDISSTSIREAIRQGRDYAGLVPAAVAQYISKEKLYV